MPLLEATIGLCINILSLPPPPIRTITPLTLAWDYLLLALAGEENCLWIPKQTEQSSHRVLKTIRAWNLNFPSKRRKSPLNHLLEYITSPLNPLKIKYSQTYMPWFAAEISLFMFFKVMKTWDNKLVRFKEYWHVDNRRVLMEDECPLLVNTNWSKKIKYPGIKGCIAML